MNGVTHWPAWHETKILCLTEKATPENEKEPPARQGPWVRRVRVGATWPAWHEMQSYYVSLKRQLQRAKKGHPRSEVEQLSIAFGPTQASSQVAPVPQVKHMAPFHFLELPPHQSIRLHFVPRRPIRTHSHPGPLSGRWLLFVLWSCLLSEV